ncbi:MAG: peptide ABC transporter ATP-binding protein [Clostridia bacterium BRH_c25]|nr:MAG: peptide ABC transporter ATP-binding protein [Clostridia bacterium BRH_c25]
MELLDIKKLSVNYHSQDKRIFAVNDVSLSINQGESLGIVGESGSGKSTLAMAVLRLLPEKTAEVSGEIQFKGRDLLKCTSSELKEIRWKELSVVFQKSMNALSPVHRIGKQLEDVYRVHDKNANKQFVKDRITKLFDMVNLSDRVYNLYPHELSGGMLQRVSIALSLLHEPPLVIFDEATTALDVVTQGQILDEIKRLEKDMNMTIMIITHDVSVVASSCKKVAVMYAGQLMEFGDVNDILVKPSHPYTQGLLCSFPTLKGERINLRGIPGSLPDLGLLPQGCVFAPRCEKVMDICHKEKPADMELSNGRKTACHMYGGAR